MVQLPEVLPTLRVDPSWVKSVYALTAVQLQKQPLAGELEVCR